MKASEISLTVYLQHILESIERIESYVEGIAFKDFEQASMIQDAVVRNMEVMGEASHNIIKFFPAYTKANAHIPLVESYGMRCSLAHGYFDISEKIVWNTIQDDLPELKEKVLKSLNALSHTHQSLHR